MKRVFRILLLMIIMTPLFLHATENYSDSERRANNYINGESYSTRNKYLIYGSGTPYKFVNGKASIDGATPASSVFKNGGLLNVEEYELSRNDSSSYLITGSPYWTMTESTTGQFFIGKYRVEAANSDSMRLSRYDTRVTEFVKPIIKVGGSGKYADPWYFISNFNVNITTNNKDYGKFEYNGEVTEEIDASVEPGKLFEVKMKTTKGYKYSGQDQCGLKVSAVNPDVFSVTVNRDIYCQAYFNEKVYKFTLDSEKYSTDPFPKELYYKFEDGWYQHYDRNTDKVSEKKLFISSPERVGYDFAGYTYNGVTVIDKYGNLRPIPADKVIDSNDTQSLTAVWNPRSDTKYTVNHYTETCNGSYELKQSVVLQGTTDTTVEIPKISLTGFSTPATISAKIKDDGTLEVRYNYLRVSKTVTVNKGTGIATVSGGGTYKYGCNYTLSSILNTGYKWVNYTGSSTINEITKTLQMGISDVNYTANGTGISYQVHYVKNDDDATGTMSDSTHVYGTPKELTNIGYSKLGYNFTGWSKTSTGNIVYSNKEQVSNLTTTDGDVINLYAHYELADPATPTITGAATKIYGASATTLTCATSTTYPSGSKKYYSFGYATSDGGSPSNWTTASTTATYSVGAKAYVGTRYYSCKVYVEDGSNKSSTITSLASADAAVRYNNAEITFDVNGGTLSGTSPLYTKADATGLFTGIRNTTAATVPTSAKANTIFAGWYTATSNGSKVINANGTLVSDTVTGYVASGKWTVTANKTLYARYTACPEGTANPSGTGTTCTLKDPATPTISGAATKIYGVSETELTCATSTTYSSGTTKYYSFGYATSEGGSPGNWTTASTTATYSVGAKAYVGTRYYSCRVYASDGTSTTSTIASAKSAVAAVTINNARITFNVNGGTLSGTSPLYTKTGVADVYDAVGSTTTATIPTSTKANTTFDGWYTAASGGSKVINANGTLVSGTVSGYVASGKWTTTQNRTLYARYTACPEGTANPSGTGTTCTLKDPATPTISGAATKIYGASATTLTCATTTNYASGINKYYSFGYATSDGGTPSNWTSVSTTNTLNVSATAYVGARYYSCRVYASDGTLTTGTTTSSTDADAAVIINNATITFNVNGGTISGTTPLYTKSGETGLFTGIRNTTAATAPKTGKVGTYFDGWYTAASGGSKVINANGTLVSGTVSGYVASGKWTTTQNRTLYAHNINCEAGTYNASASNFVCTDCPAGYYCTGGSNKTACPKATYRTATKGKKLADCTSCGNCKTTPEAGQTSNTCTWNYGDGSRNNQAKGYQGKLAIASGDTCYTDLYTRWIDNWNNTYLWTSYGNYGVWDWKSTNDHGYCSDNVLKTSGFHQAFFGARKSWIGVCKKSSGDCGSQSDPCNKSPLTTAKVSEVGTHTNGRNLGIAMTAGTKQYTLPNAVSGGNTIWFAIRNGGCGGEMSMGKIKLKISGSYYTIQQMVEKEYVEKLVIVSGESFKTNTVNDEYTGKDMGTGRFPGSDIIFMLKSGYSFQGFEAYLSKDAHPGFIPYVDYECGDGYYVRYLSTSDFRLVLNSSVVN